MRCEIPSELRKTPFTLARAAEFGVSRKVVFGPQFVRLHRGVYVHVALDLTPEARLHAAQLFLGPDAVASHLSAARLWGFAVTGSDVPQFSINRDRRVDDEVIVHIRRGQLHPLTLGGLPATGPDRTFVDCATQMSLVELVELGDHLLHAGATSVPILADYVAARHLDGVQRARQALAELDPRAESPMESLVRVCLSVSGLPALVPQVVIRDQLGDFVARVDLLAPEFRVIVEYDGRHHEREARQRQRDRERQERLDALGYRMIVVTSEDLRDLKAVPMRVYGALRQRGYRGAPPSFGSAWRYWLASPRFCSGRALAGLAKGTGATKS